MRFLTFLSAVMSLLTLIPNRKPLNLRFVLLILPKLVTGSLTPVWALLGAIGAVYNLFRLRPFYFFSGLLASLLSIRHIRLVSQSQDFLFDRAFGPGWQSRIPEERRQNMLQSRYMPLAPIPPLDYRWRRNVPFWKSPTTGLDLLCDLWLPPEGIKRSGLGIIYLHGSAWHYFDKDVGTRPFFRHLVGQGHMIMDVAYSLAPQVDMECIVCDVKRAIAWLKEHSEALGVNPERIVLIGGSAGGHLSLLAGYAPNHPRLEPADVQADTSVHAVVCYYGIADLLEMYYYLQPDPTDTGRRTWTGFNRLMLRLEPLLHRLRFVPPVTSWQDPDRWFINLLGGTPDEEFEAYKLASPISHVNGDSPPTLFIQGAHDMGGMPGQIKRLHRILVQMGATGIYLELPETDHGFDMLFPRLSPAAQTATYYVERFLALVE